MCPLASLGESPSTVMPSKLPQVLGGDRVLAHHACCRLETFVRIMLSETPGNLLDFVAPHGR
jgi:hypothetical protein